MEGAGGGRGIGRHPPTHPSTTHTPKAAHLHHAVDDEVEHTLPPSPPAHPTTHLHPVIQGEAGQYHTHPQPHPPNTPTHLHHVVEDEVGQHHQRVLAYRVIHVTQRAVHVLCRGAIQGWRAVVVGRRWGVEML